MTMSSTSLSPRIAARAIATLIAAPLLCACGGGGIDGVGGSSSGGTNPVLAGTFTAPGASTRGGDNVFGAVATNGNGFLADLNGSSRAIFAFGSASQNSQLAGSFAAYAANGSNLGNGTTLQQGTVSGTVGTQSGVTRAAATFTNSAAGFSNDATLVLDHPPLLKATLVTAAGTYKATTGTAAIASSALSTSGGAVYTVTLSSAGALTVMNDAGCSLLNNGSAVPDANYNVYALHLAGTCSATAVTLDGLAVYLPRGSASPLGGGNLAADTLLVELSDFLATGSPRYAMALVATRQ
jgi:hypothetical protein